MNQHRKLLKASIDLARWYKDSGVAVPQPVREWLKVLGESTKADNFWCTTVPVKTPFVAEMCNNATGEIMDRMSGFLYEDE